MMLVKSLLPFVLVAVVAAHPVHPPADIPTAQGQRQGMIPRLIPRASTNNTSSTTPVGMALPVHVKAVSHGAGPALPLPPSRRQEEEDPEFGDDKAEATSQRASHHHHRKPKPDQSKKGPLQALSHLASRRASKAQGNGTLPLHIAPRSNTSTSSTGPSLTHILPRGHNSTSSPMKPIIALPRTETNSTRMRPPTNSTTTTTTPGQNVTMPLMFARAETASNSTNAVVPVHVAQKNETTHLPVKRSQPSSPSQSRSGSTNSTKPLHVEVLPRSSTHSPADILLHDTPHHPDPRRATVETHVPAEKATHLLPGGHHRRQEQEQEQAPSPDPADDVDEDTDEKKTDDAPRHHQQGPANPINIVPRHSTGVAAADPLIHSGPAHAP